MRNVSKPIVTIGWTLSREQSSSVFFSPEPLSGSDKKVSDPGGVANCPAVAMLEKRVFRIRSPYTFQLRAVSTASGWHFHPVYPRTEVADGVLQTLIEFQPPSLWRRPANPVLQLVLPYVFFSDAPSDLDRGPPRSGRSTQNSSHRRRKGAGPGRNLARLAIRDQACTTRSTIDAPHGVQEKLLCRPHPRTVYTNGLEALKKPQAIRASDATRVGPRVLHRGDTSALIDLESTLCDNCIDLQWI